MCKVSLKDINKKWTNGQADGRQHVVREAQYNGQEINETQNLNLYVMSKMEINIPSRKLILNVSGNYDPLLSSV